MRIIDFPIFLDCLSSLHETSLDDDNQEYMTNSTISAIDFDKVKDEYIKNLALSVCPKSNDSLLGLENEDFVFIEFKNGCISKKIAYEIHRKIIDSTLIFTDIICHGISYMREKVYYILVYNEEKNHGDHEIDVDDIQPSQSRLRIQESITKKAKQNFVRFGLERFKGYCMKNVYTMNLNEFESEYLTTIRVQSTT